MAYMCTSTVPCNQCGHYRYDKEEGRMACFAAQDEKNAEKRPEKTAKKHE